MAEYKSHSTTELIKENILVPHIGSVVRSETIIDEAFSTKSNSMLTLHNRSFGTNHGYRFGQNYTIERVTINAHISLEEIVRMIHIEVRDMINTVLKHTLVYFMFTIL